jgi:hypothetical protein
MRRSSIGSFGKSVNLAKSLYRLSAGIIGAGDDVKHCLRCRLWMWRSRVETIGQVDVVFVGFVRPLGHEFLFRHDVVILEAPSGRAKVIAWKIEASERALLLTWSRD